MWQGLVQSMRQPASTLSRLLLLAALAALALCTPAFSASASGRAAPTPALIPQPAAMALTSGVPPVRVFDGVAIIAPPGDADAMWIARYLRDLTARTRGLRLAVRSGEGAQPGDATAIVLTRGAVSGGDEAYQLQVAPGRITIRAGATPGLFYGATTLWQLLTPDARRGAVEVPQLTIDDAPRFRWRGLMLDSARHFQSPAFVERLIDWMALEKLNVLQWHLTDDQGWRLEIKAYPRLTAVGAWRIPAGRALGAERRYGGFYTQAQARAIVAYARARSVTIVPEIEMPGHALAAIRSYPSLGADGRAPTSIESDWGVYPYLYNVDDRTFRVLQTVLGEVMALFPSPYIHTGGDEAVKDQWKASPAVQARMRALGISDEDALQGYFTDRIGAFLAAHGRRLVGWDEILGGGLPAGATVMSWHGVDGAIAAANAGHDAVLSPAPTLYFDNRQSDLADQPPGRGHITSLADVYAFDPAPPTLNAAQRSHILGLQGNLWTEHIRTPPRVAAMAFPRAAAVAEVGWSPQVARNWDDFARRLPRAFDRYRALGLPADTAALEVRPDVQFDAAQNRVRVALATEIGQGDIRYTTDGQAPTARSPRYDRPLTLSLPVALKAQAFDDGRAISPLVERRFDAWSVRRRASQDLRLCSNAVALNLEAAAPASGPRPVFLVDIMNPCWILPAADLRGVDRLEVSVGRVPFNFQLGKDIESIRLRPPATLAGELEVRKDSCDGPIVAILPLASAAARRGLTTLSGDIKGGGPHDLCFAFTARRLDPMWVINWIQLVPPDAGRPRA
jgi:hexosaminidase